MAVVQAQVAADSTPATPVELFEATADCTVNVLCVNPTSGIEEAFVERRLLDASQSAEQLRVPGAEVDAIGSLREGPITLKSGDKIYVYSSSASMVFHLDGHLSS